ncbi:MAG: 30S ribosome-binding factor RbfA [Anderseniella sp.]|jgi:ribosome-binding factor A|nr:30S ribosome-binding factor RbfA [Anderseniella sp.]
MVKSKGPSQRQLRVGELIRHELSALFMRGDVMDPVIEKQGVTVLEVTTSPDLKIATAYVRPFQPGGDPGALIEALNRNRKFIRGELAPKLELKFMPEFRFKIDTASDYASRIERLMADPRVARDLDGDD